MKRKTTTSASMLSQHCRHGKRHSRYLTHTQHLILTPGFMIRCFFPPTSASSYIFNKPFLLITRTLGFPIVGWTVQSNEAASGRG